MAQIPGLNYAQPKTKTKGGAGDSHVSRVCTVVEADVSRCVVTFQLRGAPQRAVLPFSRLFSPEGACSHPQPPQLRDKICCDMSLAQIDSLDAQWLVSFAWRGKLEPATRSAPLSGLHAVRGMVAEVAGDAGVLLFVMGGGRERCAFGRAATQPHSAHLEPGESVVFDCRPTTATANCRWSADQVWRLDSSTDSDHVDDDEDEPYDEGGVGGGGGGSFIQREMLKSQVGKVALVFNYKAVLTFDHGAQRCRALLLTAKYSFPERTTALERRDLTRVLARGDQVLFTCHEYDKPDGSDRCGWFVLEAAKYEPETKAVSREAGYFQRGHLYEKIGQVSDVFTREGMLNFVLEGRREVALFSLAEVFINGKPCQGRLSDALSIGQRVNFNAKPTPERRYDAEWICTCVWRGEQPTVKQSQCRPEATTGKKAKNRTAGRSSINQLDDFDVTEPAADGGDWSKVPAPVPTTAGLLERLTVSDGAGSKPKRSPKIAGLGDFSLEGVGGGEDGAEWCCDASVGGLVQLDAGGDASCSLVSGGPAYRADSPVAANRDQRRPVAAPTSEPSPGQRPTDPAHTRPQLVQLDQRSGDAPPPRPADRAFIVPLMDSIVPPPRLLPNSSAVVVAVTAPPGFHSVPTPAAQLAAEAAAAVAAAVPASQHSSLPSTSAATDQRLRPEQRVTTATNGYLTEQQAESLANGPSPSSCHLHTTAEPYRQQQAALVTTGPALPPGHLHTTGEPYRQQQAAAFAAGPAPPPGHLHTTAEPYRQQQAAALAAGPAPPPGHLHTTAEPYRQQQAAPVGGQLQQSGHVRSAEPGRQALFPTPPPMAAPLQQLVHWPAAPHAMAAPFMYGSPMRYMLSLGGGQAMVPPLAVAGGWPAHVGWRMAQPASVPPAAVGRTPASCMAGTLSGAPPPSEPTTSQAAGLTQRRGAAPPTSEPAAAPPTSEPAAAHQSALEVCADTGHQDAVGDTRANPPTPSPSPPPLPTVTPVKGRGTILAFVDETCGLASWERDGVAEEVKFDRSVCFWLGARMDTLDLTDCYSAGEEVSFECVPAPADQPYNWVATRLQQVNE